MQNHGTCSFFPPVVHDYRWEKDYKVDKLTLHSEAHHQAGGACRVGSGAGVPARVAGLGEGDLQSPRAQYPLTESLRQGLAVLVPGHGGRGGALGLAL